MKLTSIALLLVSLVTSSNCGQNYNSQSGDEALANLNLDCSSPGGTQLCAAGVVMSTNQCFGCHGGWAAYRTNADWLASGLVDAGSPSTSPIITNLINSGGEMPKNGSALSNDDYETLATWIQSL